MGAESSQLRGQSNPGSEPLGVRLSRWGRERGWGAVEFGWDGEQTAKLGPVIGYGQTFNEALNNLADGLIKEGWEDDRDG